MKKTAAAIKQTNRISNPFNRLFLTAIKYNKEINPTSKTAIAIWKNIETIYPAS